MGTSKSASAAVASPAVISGPGVSVIFSTPTTSARSTAPVATAQPGRRGNPRRRNRTPPRPCTASTPRSPTQSATRAPRLSWPGRAAGRQHVGDQQGIDVVKPGVVQCVEGRPSGQIDHGKVPVFGDLQHPGAVNRNVTHGVFDDLRGGRGDCPLPAGPRPMLSERAAAGPDHWRREHKGPPWGGPSDRPSRKELRRPSASAGTCSRTPASRDRHPSAGAA